MYHCWWCVHATRIRGSCTRPTDIKYVFTSEHADCLKADETAKAIVLIVYRADGYSGTITVDLCTSPGAYTVSDVRQTNSSEYCTNRISKGTTSGDLSYGLILLQLAGHVLVDIQVLLLHKYVPVLGTRYKDEADCIHPSTATGYTKGTMGGDLSKGSDFAQPGLVQLITKVLLLHKYVPLLVVRTRC